MVNKFAGIVDSQIDSSTISVKVIIGVNSKYRKIVKKSKKYLVHNKNNCYNQGDKVYFICCKPISKRKKWVVINNDHIDKKK